MQQQSASLPGAAFSDTAVPPASAPGKASAPLQPDKDRPLIPAAETANLPPLEPGRPPATTKVKP
jgi:hypothetical protein